MSVAAPLREPVVSPLQRLAFLSLLLYLFLLHSRVLDLTFSYLHIPIISLYVAVLAAFLGGGVMRAFSNRIGLVLLLLTFWMTACIPFSVWPGGAAQTVKDWFKTMLVYFVITGLVTTFDQFRRTVYMLAYSILALALLTVVFGDMSEGRLVLARGRFTNPNDLAQIFLMGLPLWWYIATDKSLKTWRRVSAGIAMALIFMMMSKTGSRGALIASLVVALVLFWRSSVSHKVLLLFGACVLVVMAAVFLPKATKDRYFTFLSDDDQVGESALEGRIEASAVSSTWGRWGLLKDSITLTMLNPLFGVGAGQFVVAQDLYSRAVRNQKGSWHVTHNTFTEFSSENGLPALLFYVLGLVFAFRATRLPPAVRARPSPQYEELNSVSFCLRLSLLSYVVSCCFGSFAYATQYPVLAALSLVFARTVATEAARSQKPESAPAPPRTRVPRLRPASVLPRSRIIGMRA